MARILVVEDTELLRRIYEDRLEQDGHEVTTAADGQECLHIVRSQDVDLILLDLIMPKMSGLEALEALKGDPRTHDIPVIILSNLGQDADIQRGLAMGATDYLIKNSARPADVAEKIRQALESGTASDAAHAESFQLRVRDEDADAFLAASGLPRRFWCPACEEELAIELVAKADREGWYDAHFVCPRCERAY